MQISENDFTPNIRRVVFYKSKMFQTITASAAIIDSCVDFFLSQSNQKDSGSLSQIFEEDLKYLARFCIDGQTATLLGLLAARSVLNLFTKNLKRRLHYILLPTAGEKSILLGMAELKNARDDLLSRRISTVKVFLKSEFDHLLVLLENMFRQFKNFKRIYERTTVTSLSTVLDDLKAEVFLRQETLYESLFRGPGRSRQNSPYIYEIVSCKRSNETRGAVESEKRMRSLD